MLAYIWLLIISNVDGGPQMSLNVPEQMEHDSSSKSGIRSAKEGEYIIAPSLDPGGLDEIGLIRAIADHSSDSVRSKARLQALTAELICKKQRRGALQSDPSVEAHRQLPLSASIANRVRDRTILVTGGAGCIGRILVQRLLQYGPRRVIVISRSPVTRDASVHRLVREAHVDIRDRDSLAAVFARYRPDVVYHLAAQRLPSLGEIQIIDTISTNVFGTRNIVDLSREFGVLQCLVVSTAKAVNYFPSQVYNQTKKLEEWVVLAAPVHNGPAYGVIRLTHVLDNSWLLYKMREGMAKGLVALQAPDVSFYAQRVEEATDLLLNALPLVEVGRARIFSAADLGWPINLLDLALYRIYESRSGAGVYFTGAQPGYEDHIFRGVVDWTAPTRSLPHVLHNAVERRIEDSHHISAVGVVASYAPPCDADILGAVLDELQGEVMGIPIGPIRLRASLYRAVFRLTLHMFSEISPEYLLKIARWGASPAILGLTGTVVTHHRDTLIPLLQSLLPKITLELCLRSGWHGHEWEAFLDAVSEIPELKELVTEWRSSVGHRAISMGAIG